MLNKYYAISPLIAGVIMISTRKAISLRLNASRIAKSGRLRHHDL